MSQMRRTCGRLFPFDFRPGSPAATPGVYDVVYADPANEERFADRVHLGRRVDGAAGGVVGIEHPWCGDVAFVLAVEDLFGIDVRMTDSEAVWRGAWYDGSDHPVCMASSVPELLAIAAARGAGFQVMMTGPMFDLASWCSEGRR